jgi:Spy/CpxP family protein refolding chaperone
MDWINQNKFKNWLVIILFAVNIMTVSVLWVQLLREKPAAATTAAGGNTESVNLMKRELDLNDWQTQQLEKLRNSKLDLVRLYNDSLDQLKKQLAEQLFLKNQDSATITRWAKSIGDLEAKVTLLRFQHFQELLAICTPAQQNKLKPILTDVIGRRPPKPAEKENPREGTRSPRPEQEKANPDNKSGEAQDNPDNRPEPPPVDRKIDKLVTRLSLSAEQTEKIKKIMLDSEAKKKELKKMPHPDHQFIEAEKAKLQKAEDEAIKAVLDQNQKNDFEKMLAKRNKE